MNLRVFRLALGALALVLLLAQPGVLYGQADAPAVETPAGAATPVRAISVGAAIPSLR